MLATKEYERTRALLYARRWAFARNPQYYNFDMLGGDCTNFASQCLFAGCGVMNFTPDLGWFYENLNNRAPAWTGVEFFYNFLIGNAMDITPTMLNYQTHADNGSMYNTPNCFNIYVCGKVFKWLKKMGGLEVMKQRNEEKAKILYDFLDESKMFKGTVRKEDRSLMNVPFVTGDKELDAKFVKEAKAAGFENLKGHRSVGGMRASIYNAMPIEGVEKLVEFMKKFEKENA